MQTIRNKRTGETLTGEIATHYATLPAFGFRISGCSRLYAFENSEWDILPPPLPTGIGAVVRDASGRIYVRLGSWESPWKYAIAGNLDYSDDEITKSGPVTILSQGVNLSGSAE